MDPDNLYAKVTASEKIDKLNHLSASIAATVEIKSRVFFCFYDILRNISNSSKMPSKIHLSLENYQNIY